jgi:hypothetical protein
VFQYANHAINETVTLDEAEQVTNRLIDLIAAKPPDAFCRASEMRGNTLPTINNAFFLIIAARRHVAHDDETLHGISREYADKVEALVGSLSVVVLPDDDMDRLNRLQKGSSEFNRVRIDAVLRRMAQCDLELKKVPNRESFLSFNDYCWSLNPRDPLYWQRIYTHLDLPYDENSPIGEADLALDERGHLVCKFASSKDRQKLPFYRFFL